MPNVEAIDQGPMKGKSSNQTLRPNLIGLFVTAFYGLLLLGLYHSALTTMVGQWERDEYSYGYLIPFVILYLIWSHKRTVKFPMFGQQVPKDPFYGDKRWEQAKLIKQHTLDYLKQRIHEFEENGKDVDEPPTTNPSALLPIGASFVSSFCCLESPLPDGSTAI